MSAEELNHLLLTNPYINETLAYLYFNDKISDKEKKSLQSSAVKPPQRWSQDEHNKFLQALKIHGKDYESISSINKIIS